MKDKLYKLNRNKNYYLIRRILLGSVILFSSLIVAAIPLSISLIENNEIPQLKHSFKNETNDSLDKQDLSKPYLSI